MRQPIRTHKSADGRRQQLVRTARWRIIRPVKEKPNIWLPILLMAVFALTRWPGLLPQNFSAAYALAFCAGVYFPRRLAWWLPLSTLLVTNILLNVCYYSAGVFDWFMLVTLLAYAILIALGQCFNARSSWLKLLGGGLLGAVLFYFVTNTAAWIYEPTQPYPKTFLGWIQALTVGTSGWPETWKFFRNTLLSSGIFTGLFVGAMMLSEKLESTREKQADEEPALEQDPNAPAAEEQPQD